LEQPVGLQLVLKGSRGSLNYGVNAPLKVGGVAMRSYFDVTGVNKYDAILGAPFLRHHRAMLNFNKPSIITAGRTYPTQYRADTPSDGIAAAATRVRNASSVRGEPPPAKLPPLQEVNHNIHFVDDTLKTTYHKSWCPKALWPQLMAKIAKYTEAQWWLDGAAAEAAPMLCLFK
ncbi:hypothetical protein BDV93DRAFT_407619, partial [Ceratobasidium sp. AG-I]